MPIAKITGQGLAAIAVSVALLWGCFVGEHLILNRTHVRRAQVIRELRQMQLLHGTQPVSAPQPDNPHRSNTTIG